MTVPISSLRAPGGVKRRRISAKRSGPPRPAVEQGIALLAGDLGKFTACPRHPLVFVARQIESVDSARVSAALDRFPWFSVGSQDDWKILHLRRPLGAAKRQSYQVATDPPLPTRPAFRCGFFNMPARRRAPRSLPPPLA